MLVLISYDVATKDAKGRKRLRKVAKTCEDYGVRVQNSVFECSVNPAKWTLLRQNLLDIYDDSEDSLRFYFLGSNYQNKVEHHGAKKKPDLDIDPLII